MTSKKTQNTLSTSNRSKINRHQHHQGKVTVVCGELVGPMQIYIYGQVHTILSHILLTTSHSKYEKVTRTGFFFNDDRSIIRITFLISYSTKLSEYK